jgi:hypothetical protein
MSEVEQLEQKIQNLPEAELAKFRAWFAEFDANAWDRQFERDAGAGKLDALADKALRDHAAGKTKPL